jgi:hypothetical protein
MMKYVSGEDLPYGTLVYYWKRSSDKHSDYITPGYITRTHINHDATLRYQNFNTFCYFLDEGLWATQYVIDEWRINVHLHPYCTLFDILLSQCEKLQLTESYSKR